MKDLVKYTENPIAIKAIPEKDLDLVLNKPFKHWLCQLLSITVENEEKLDAALPVIKKHFWSLGFPEIKEAFEMYADNQLNLTPRSNYFDRVLVGQIFEAYKQHKKTKPVKSDPDKDKDIQDYTDAVNWFDWWVQNNKVTEQMTWLFDYLELKCDAFNPKKKVMMDWIDKEIDENHEQEKTAFRKAKRTMVKLFFQHIHAKGKHLKEFLN